MLCAWESFFNTCGEPQAFEICSFGSSAQPPVRKTIKLWKAMTEREVYLLISDSKFTGKIEYIIPER